MQTPCRQANPPRQTPVKTLPQTSFAGGKNPSFPEMQKLTMLALLYCLNLKIRWIEKSVASITIQTTMLIWIETNLAVVSHLFTLKVV